LFSIYENGLSFKEVFEEVLGSEQVIIDNNKLAKKDGYDLKPGGQSH